MFGWQLNLPDNQNDQALAHGKRVRGGFNLSADLQIGATPTRETE
jgi:hypothetical protein